MQRPPNRRALAVVQDIERDVQQLAVLWPTTKNGHMGGQGRHTQGACQAKRARASSSSSRCRHQAHSPPPGACGTRGQSPPPPAQPSPSSAVPPAWCVHGSEDARQLSPAGMNTLQRPPTHRQHPPARPPTHLQLGVGRLALLDGADQRLQRTERLKLAPARMCGDMCRDTGLGFRARERVGAGARRPSRVGRAAAAAGGAAARAPASLQLQLRAPCCPSPGPPTAACSTRSALRPGCRDRWCSAQSSRWPRCRDGSMGA